MDKRTRGRPPKDEASRKSEPVSIRISRGLRGRLEEERTKAVPERSLSQEVELRLRESFDLDKTVKQLLGGPEHYWLMRIIAQQIAVIEHQTGRAFRKDRYTFDQVKGCIETL